MNAVGSTVNVIEVGLKKFGLTAKYLSAILAILGSGSGFAGDKHDERVVHDDNTAQSSDHDTHGLHATLDAGSFAGHFNREGNPVGDPVHIIDFHAMIPLSRANLILAHEGVFGDNGFREEVAKIGIEFDRYPWLFGLYFNNYQTHELEIHHTDHHKDRSSHGRGHESHDEKHVARSPWKDLDLSTIQLEVSREVGKHVSIFGGSEFVLDQDSNGQPHVVYVGVGYQGTIGKKKEWDVEARIRAVHSFGSDEQEGGTAIVGEIEAVKKRVFLNPAKRAAYKRGEEVDGGFRLGVGVHASTKRDVSAGFIFSTTF